MVGREGVAAAALALRWGSYLAVLLDRDKPVWSAARSGGMSRIGDQEMDQVRLRRRPHLDPLSAVGVIHSRLQETGDPVSRSGYIVGELQ
jgi:hypothetical protein